MKSRLEGDLVPGEAEAVSKSTITEPCDSPAAPDLAARRLLERWVRAGTSPQRLVTRSRIVLLMLDNVPQRQIAERLGVARGTVRLWIRRFRPGGPDALLHDAPGRGRPAAVNAETLKEQLRIANLLDSAGRPVSLRRAAALVGVSPSTLWRALKRAE